jgi:hypothetical protein
VNHSLYVFHSLLSYGQSPSLKLKTCTERWLRVVNGVLRNSYASICLCSSASYLGRRGNWLAKRMLSSSLGIALDIRRKSAIRYPCNLLRKI